MGKVWGWYKKLFTQKNKDKNKDKQTDYLGYNKVMEPPLYRYKEHGLLAKPASAPYVFVA